MTEYEREPYVKKAAQLKEENERLNEAAIEQKKAQLQQSDMIGNLEAQGKDTILDKRSINTLAKKVAQAEDISNRIDN